MSTPRIPPVPPNKGGELDKTNPTQHRKVEKVEKISNISEVDDESRARQFRQFVEAPDEEEHNLPSPLNVMSTSNGKGQEAASIKSHSTSSRKRTVSSPQPAPQTPQASPQPYSAQTKTTNQTALPTPSPTYSAPPSTYLSGAAPQSYQEETSLPQSQLFWGSIPESSNSNQSSSNQPQMQETSRSSSRVFLNGQEKDQEVNQSESSSSESEETEPASSSSERKKQGKGALFGDSSFELSDETESKGVMGARETSSFGRTKEEELLKSKEKKGKSEWVSAEFETLDREERAFLPLEETEEKKEHLGPEGVIAPYGEKGPRHIGPLASEKREASSFLEEEEPGYKGSLPSEEKKVATQEPRAMREGQTKPFIKEEHSETLKKEEAGTSWDKEEGRGKKRSHKEELASLLPASPTTTPLPDFVIPAAAAAASAAEPYLGPEALSMYFHMIGTIVAMVSPKGDSRTEFMLNAPSFANSKFYGSTIIIERFATAPYQLNIRLTGSNEAVHAFNQNIPLLFSAFKNGNFAFTINRIEAVYEKPLFRRKEAAGEKGEKGFGESGNRGDRGQ